MGEMEHEDMRKTILWRMIVEYQGRWEILEPSAKRQADLAYDAGSQ